MGQLALASQWAAHRLAPTNLVYLKHLTLAYKIGKSLNAKVIPQDDFYKVKKINTMMLIALRTKKIWIKMLQQGMKIGIYQNHLE